MFIAGEKKKKWMFYNRNENYEVQLFSTYLRMTVSKENEVFMSFHVPTCWMWLDYKCLSSRKTIYWFFLQQNISVAQTTKSKKKFIQTLKLQIKLINLVKAEYSGSFGCFFLFVCPDISFAFRGAADVLQPGCSPSLSGRSPGPVPGGALPPHSSQWWRLSPQIRCT